MTDVTQMLRRWREGDSEARDRVLPVVYDELRRLARARLRGERPGHTLGTTGLVHEARRNQAARSITATSRSMRLPAAI